MSNIKLGQLLVIALCRARLLLESKNVFLSFEHVSRWVVLTASEYLDKLKLWQNVSARRCCDGFCRRFSEHCDTNRRMLLMGYLGTSGGKRAAINLFVGSDPRANWRTGASHAATMEVGGYLFSELRAAPLESRLIAEPLVYAIGYHLGARIPHCEHCLDHCWGQSHHSCTNSSGSNNHIHEQAASLLKRSCCLRMGFAPPPLRN